MRENIFGTAATIAAISLWKNATMAASVPTWSATSKARPKSAGTSQPKNARARMRCAELDTGRNSVSPCTMPSSTAAAKFTVGVV